MKPNQAPPLTISYLKERLVKLHGATPEQADQWINERFEDVNGLAKPKKALLKMAASSIRVLPATAEIQNGPCIDCEHWGVASKECLIEKAPIEMKCPSYKLFQHD